MRWDSGNFLYFTIFWAKEPQVQLHLSLKSVVVVQCECESLVCAIVQVPLDLVLLLCFV